jgi:Ca2+-binding RTX toxin-like protein
LGDFLYQTELGDTVSFRAGIAPSDLLLSRVDDDLILKITGTTDQLTVAYQFSSLTAGALSRIERFVFADGTMWTALDVDARVIAAAKTTGNDAINGYNLDERLEGGLGDDTLNGSYGSDTYIYTSGDGNDTIRDWAFWMDKGNVFEHDRIQFTNVNANGITLAKAANLTDMVVRITATNQTITVIDQFRVAGEAWGIEAIQFGDGTIWDAFSSQQHGWQRRRHHGE